MVWAAILGWSPVVSAAPYLLQQCPDDGRPVALHQALLVHRVVLDEVFHQQQEGGHAVPLQPALCKARGELGATSSLPPGSFPPFCSHGQPGDPTTKLALHLISPKLNQAESSGCSEKPHFSARKLAAGFREESHVTKASVTKTSGSCRTPGTSCKSKTGARQARATLTFPEPLIYD